MNISLEDLVRMVWKKFDGDKIMERMYGYEIFGLTTA